MGDICTLTGWGEAKSITEMVLHPWGPILAVVLPFRYGGDLAGAASRPDGLAVLGVLFAVAEEDNPKFEPMLEAAQLIKDREIIH